MPQVVAVAAAWVAKTLTVKAVAAFVVKTALQAVASVALSKAAKALGLSKQSIQERQASVTSLSLGEGPREAAFGVVCTGGTLLDAFNFGGKYGTDTVTRIIALADHPVDAIVGYYVDDVYYAWTGDGVQPGFNGKLSIEFKNGVAAGNVPPLHVRQHGGWTVNDVLAGVTHVVVDTRYDDAVWTQGHPRFKFVLRGLRVYDPRRDPALGYTGPDPQTWEDTSTHAFSRNAALNRYAYERGIYAAGHQGEADHLLIGRGLTAEEAPPSRIIAAANLCDELVDGEMRYAAEGVIFANQSFDEVEELFAAAMAGVLVQREGGLEIEPGQAKAAVVTITDGDLVVGKPVGFSPFLPDSDGGRINTVVPRYVEPTQGWLDHAAPVIRDLSRMAPAPVGDGGPREMTLPLALVTVGNQANRNGGIALRKAALERRATITLPPRFAGIEEGDWIAWTSARRFGGATVRFRVVSFSLDAGWQNSLVLEEIASSVYGVPDPVEDLVLPPPAPVPVDALQLLGVTAEAITLAGETSTLPAVRFGWDVDVEDTAITGIRAEIRKVGETEAATTRLDDVAAGRAVVTGGVWPDQVLECRLVPQGDPTRPVLASNWITVNTTAVTAEIDPATLAAIDADIAALFGDVFDVSAALSDAQDLIDVQGVEIAAARGGQANLSARIVQVNQARIDGDTSNATAISALEARTDTTEADLIDLEIALASETTARGEQISQIRASGAGGSINANPSFAAFPDGAAVPTNWTAWGRQDNVRVAGRFSTYGFQQHDNTAGVLEDCGLVQNATWPGLTGAAAGYYVIEADVRLLAGGYRGAGVLLYAGGYGVGSIATLHIGSEPDVNGHVGYTIAVPSRSFRKLVRLENIADGNLTLHLMTNWNAGFGIQDAKIIVWDHCAVRPATDAEIAAGTVLPGLSATVTEHSLSIIDLELQAALASYEVVASASGGQPAILRLVSSTAGGYAVLAGPKVVLGTLDGSTLIEVLSIYGTKARFSGDVEIDGNLTLDGTLNGATKIIKGSVAPRVSTYAAGTVSLSGTTVTQVAEQIITTSGSKVEVTFNALMDMQHAPSSSFTLTIEMRREMISGPYGAGGDLQILAESVNGAGDTADNFTGKWPIIVKDNPLAGTWRYYVRAQVSASNMSVANVKNRFMSAEEELTNA